MSLAYDYIMKTREPVKEFRSHCITGICFSIFRRGSLWYDSIWLYLLAYFLHRKHNTAQWHTSEYQWFIVLKCVFNWKVKMEISLGDKRISCLHLECKSIYLSVSRYSYTLAFKWWQCDVCEPYMLTLCSNTDAGAPSAWCLSFW